jgi:hypothetical protein
VLLALKVGQIGEANRSMDESRQIRPRSLGGRGFWHKKYLPLPIARGVSFVGLMCVRRRLMPSGETVADPAAGPV